MSGVVTGLPVIAQSREPAWVRNGSRSTQQSYQEALAFEQVMVEQLSSSLVPKSEEGEGALGEEGAQSSEPGMSALAPQALAGAIMGDGGLGLAAELTRAMTHTGENVTGASDGVSAMTHTDGNVIGASDGVSAMTHTGENVIGASGGVSAEAAR